MPLSPKRQGDPESAKYFIFVLEKPASFKASLIKTAAVVTQAPLMEGVSGEIAKGRISWWMSWAARVSHMDLCWIFTSAVLAGTSVLPYWDTPCRPCSASAAVRPWLRTACSVIPSSLVNRKQMACQRKPISSLWKTYLLHSQGNGCCFDQKYDWFRCGSQLGYSVIQCSGPLLPLLQ